MVNHAPPQLQLIFTPPYPIPAVSFRLAQADDLLPLNTNCYPETDWERFREHYSYLLKWQENGRSYVLVAEYQEPTHDEEIREDGSRIIIGSGQLIPRGNMAEIAELAVHPEYRNQGIGTAMIQILTGIARQRQTDELEIGAAVENRAALRLYRRLGFGRERSLQLPTGQEVVILNKSLAKRQHHERQAN